jgi:hypothetical protein
MSEPQARVILFGAGKGGEHSFHRLRGEYHVVGFADNDSSKQGGTFCGLQVYAPSDFKKLDYNKIIICSMYDKDIRKQLVEHYNIPKNNIATFSLKKPRLSATQGILQHVKNKLIILRSRYLCSVCGRKVYQFKPLPPYYAEMANKYGVVRAGFSSETCNRDAYTCPHCGASDRSRLYALYLDEVFSSELRNGFTIVEFAPCAALQKFITRRKCNSDGKIKSITSDLMKPGVDVKADICAMPEFKDQSVDFFICSHTSVRFNLLKH